MDSLPAFVHHCQQRTLSICIVGAHSCLRCIELTIRVLIAPLWLLANVILTVFNTFIFCLTAPFRSYLDPLEAQSKQTYNYEKWRSLQARIDNRRRVHTWTLRDHDPSYDCRGLRKFKEDLESSRRNEDVRALRNNLRAQATRNSCSILSSRLFQKSNIQTKRLIHDYIHEVRKSVECLAKQETTGRSSSTHDAEENRKVISDIRQILGRTTLVLQGGAMLSMCHLGVIRALHRRRLLPRIITATGTGALVAAIIACCPDDKVLSALDGHSINIDAFVAAREQRLSAHTSHFPGASWLRAVRRRLERFWATGHFFDIDVLTQCVRDNIGDITFEEAYARSDRILNITIAKPNVEGTPQLLNYITAPHVVVWSAVAASVATARSMFAAAPLQCKNDVGIIEQYFAVDSAPSSGPRRPLAHPRIPMERIGELFDVNHYIVSQTRPYIIPFVRLRDFMCQDPILGSVTKFIYCEFLHRMDTLNRMGLIPTPLQRILIDELIPSTSNWSKFVIAPEVTFLDYFRIFNFPSPQVINRWAMKGERSVWPKICQIKVRCSVEFDIDAAYSRDSAKLQMRGTHGQRVDVNGYH